MSYLTVQHNTNHGKVSRPGEVHYPLQIEKSPYSQKL